MSDDLCTRLRVPIRYVYGFAIDDAMCANLAIANKDRAEAADKIERAQSATLIVTESMRQWELRAKSADARCAELLERAQLAESYGAQVSVERDEAKARCAELEADAARYRWLRDHPTFHTGACLLIAADPGDLHGDVTGQAQWIDSHIDAARAAPTRGEGE